MGVFYDSLEFAAPSDIICHASEAPPLTLLQDLQDPLEDETAEREQLELHKSKLEGQINDLQRQLKEIGRASCRERV